MIVGTSPSRRGHLGCPALSFVFHSRCCRSERFSEWSLPGNHFSPLTMKSLPGIASLAVGSYRHRTNSRELYIESLQSREWEKSLTVLQCNGPVKVREEDVLWVRLQVRQISYRTHGRFPWLIVGRSGGKALGEKRVNERTSK